MRTGSLSPHRPYRCTDVLYIPSSTWLVDNRHAVLPARRVAPALGGPPPRPEARRPYRPPAATAPRRPGRPVVTAYRSRRCCSVHGRLRTAIAASNAEPVHHHSSARFVPGCPGADGLLPIPCSIVRHKPTTRAVLEPNKPHRS